MRYGDTYAHSYCNTNPKSYSDSFGNVYTQSYCNTNTNANTDSNSDSDSDSAATYTNANGNDTISYGDTYTNANGKPIWECLSAATDDRPYQGSQHSGQFHGISKHH